jgi:hypothetical protein
MLCYAMLVTNTHLQYIYKYIYIYIDSFIANQCKVSAVLIGCVHWLEITHVRYVARR